MKPNKVLRDIFFHLLSLDYVQNMLQLEGFTSGQLTNTKISHNM